MLVFGASGGVGSIAVQIAHQPGARIIATASGRAAATFVHRIGADAVVDVRKDNAIDRLKELALGGLDAVLALVGGDTLEQCLRTPADRRSRSSPQWN